MSLRNARRLSFSVNDLRAVGFNSKSHLLVAATTCSSTSKPKVWLLPGENQHHRDCWSAALANDCRRDRFKMDARHLASKPGFRERASGVEKGGKERQHRWIFDPLHFAEMSILRIPYVCDFANFAEQHFVRYTCQLLSLKDTRRAALSQRFLAEQ